MPKKTNIHQIVSIRRRRKYSRAAGGMGADLWRIPVRTCAMALVLLVVTLSIDKAAASGAIQLPRWLSVGGYEDTQSLLAAMMGAVSTVVALVFSVTLLVYSVAASQLGPRLVYRFIRDRMMQYTVGMFLASFLFLLLTFVTLRRERGHEFVPQLTTVVSVFLVIGSFATLVAYNHRVATSIQTNDAVAQIVDDLVQVMQGLRAEQLDNSADLTSSSPTSSGEIDRDQILARFETHAAPILAPRSGYIERISRKELFAATMQSDTTVELLFRPGQFISEDEPVARVLPAERAEAIATAVLASVAVGPNRTLEQDVEFAVAQLVEVALRALSPAVNDTFTALACIDWIGEAIRMFAALPASEGIWCGPDGHPRLVERPLPFPRVVKSAFDQIRQSGADNPAVIIRLLQTWGRIAPQLNADQRSVLLEQVESVRESITQQAFTKSDGADIETTAGQTAHDLSMSSG